MDFYKKREDAGLLDRREAFKEKINRLNKNIELCKEYKEEAIKQVRSLEEQYRKRIFSYTEYEYLLNQYLKGLSLDYWVNHYESQEKNIKEKINSLKLQKQQYPLERERIILEKHGTNLDYKTLAYSFIAVMLIIGLAFSYYQIFEPSSDNLITGFGVIEQNKDMFIINYIPDSDVTVKAGESQIFTITTQPLENLLIQWYVNNMAVEGQNAETFIYTAETPGEYEVKVLVHDSKDYTSHKWVLTVAAKEEATPETANETLPEEANIIAPEENKSEEEPTVNETAENVMLPELNETVIGNATEEGLLEENITTPENETGSVETEENISSQITSIEQLPAEVNKPVQWLIRANRTNETYLIVELPAQAAAISVGRIIKTPTLKIGDIIEPVSKENVTLKKGVLSVSLSTYDLTEQSTTGFFTASMQEKGLLSTITDWLSFKFLVYKTFYKAYSAIKKVSLRGRQSLTTFAIASEEKITLVIEDDADEFEISYQTPAPRIIEKEEVSRKLVTVYSDLGYTNVLTYTKIREDREVLGVSWLTNESKVNMTYESYDENINGLVDKISWVTPHLSEQTFEILFSEGQGYVDTDLTADVYIPASEVYYITNCPKGSCSPPIDTNLLYLEENPEYFYTAINAPVTVLGDDFGAQMIFDLKTVPETFSQAFICGYAASMLDEKSLTNYIEILDDENKLLSVEGVEEDWASGIVNKAPGWNCIDITEQLKQRNDNRLAVRWWGPDDDKKRPIRFVIFSAIISLEKCEGRNPSNVEDCRPFIGIKL